jgi:hypothetical protein
MGFLLVFLGFRFKHITKTSAGARQRRAIRCMCLLDNSLNRTVPFYSTSFYRFSGFLFFSFKAHNPIFPLQACSTSDEIEATPSLEFIAL